ncbi:MAG TPA: LysE family transporter [Syntrophales bacterium]|nr:LysE family transporter [Syntrophales bacterium]
MVTLLSAAAVYGLSAGFLPGPLLALVISQTLRYGTREGAKAAMAPLITDLPIILVSVLVMRSLSESRTALGLISMAGGLFVIYLACECFRTTRLELSDSEIGPQSLGRGAAVNALNPHPYLFWLTVGGPSVIREWAESPLGAVAFVAVFTGCIVGSKVLIAAAVGRSRHMLSGKVYGAVMRALGLMLLVFAALLFRDGLALAGW